MRTRACEMVGVPADDDQANQTVGEDDLLADLDVLEEMRDSRRRRGRVRSTASDPGMIRRISSAVNSDRSAAE